MKSCNIINNYIILYYILYILYILNWSTKNKFKFRQKIKFCPKNDNLWNRKSNLIATPVGVPCANKLLGCY